MISELLDWVGRTVRGDKRGAIPPELAPILSRLELTAQELLQQVWQFSSPTDNLSVPLVDPPVSISISEPVVV